MSSDRHRLSRPPFVAMVILRFLLQPLGREAMLGDLHKEHAVRQVAEGRWRAWRWYWVELGRCVGPSLHRTVSRHNLRRRADRREAREQEFRGV